jgi:RND superfamily putative drug exporter
VLLFVFIFGLSMDYEVFLLARIKEEYDQRPDTNRAVLRGITKSGPVVTAAAICIVIVFLGFTVGGLVAVKEIGVGMTVAVIIDVTVVRGLLLPALMTMLDTWNWWAPGFLSSLRPVPAGALAKAVQAKPAKVRPAEELTVEVPALTAKPARIPAPTPAADDLTVEVPALVAEANPPAEAASSDNV